MQLQRSEEGTLSRTEGTCWPQPHQVVLSICEKAQGISDGTKERGREGLVEGSVVEFLWVGW